MRSRNHDEDDVAVDMAPLIDCVFLLLIFFLVATTLKKLDRELQVELPDAVAAIQTKLEPGTLVVGLDVNGGIYLGAEPVTIDQFHEKLRQTAAENPDARVRINADRDTRYDDIIHVIDQCLFWDLNNVGFHLRDSRGGSAGR